MCCEEVRIESNEPISLMKGSLLVREHLWECRVDEKMGKRQAKADEPGKKPRGKTPAAPHSGVKDSDQIKVTDEVSRIVPVLKTSSLDETVLTLRA